VTQLQSQDTSINGYQSLNAANASLLNGINSFQVFKHASTCKLSFNSDVQPQVQPTTQNFSQVAGSAVNSAIQTPITTIQSFQQIFQ
jgi:hypothetical protein